MGTPHTMHDPVGLLSSMETPKGYVVLRDGRIKFPNGITVKIEDIEITSMHSITLRPGDLLAVKVGTHLTRDQFDKLRAHIDQQVPGHDILILDAGMSLAVVGQD